MVEKGCCPYSYAQQPVPWGAYSRPPQKVSTHPVDGNVVALQDMHLTAIEQLAYQTQHPSDDSRAVVRLTSESPEPEPEQAASSDN